MSSIIVARVLGKEGFGQLGIIQSTVGMFGVFAGFGLSLTATKKVAEYKTHDPTKAGRIIILTNFVAIISGSIITIIFIIISPWLANHTLASPYLSKYLQIGTGLLLLGALIGVQNGILSGFEAFKTIAKINFFSGIVSFPLIVLGVYFRGLNGALWGAVLGMGINWLLNHFAIKAEAHKSLLILDYKNCIKEWKILRDFSAPVFLASASTGPITWICNALLVNQSNGYAEMGMFNAANIFRTMIMFIPLLLLQASFPALSSNYGIYKTDGQFKQILYFTHNLINLPLILICLVIISFPKYFMAFYGKDFQNGSLVLIGLMACVMVQGLGSTVGSTMQAKGDVWFGFLLNSIWGIILIAIVFFTVKNLHSISLSYGYLISTIFLLIFQIKRLKKDIHNKLIKKIYFLLSIIIIISIIGSFAVFFQGKLVSFLKIIYILFLTLIFIKYPIIIINDDKI